MLMLLVLLQFCKSEKDIAPGAAREAKLLTGGSNKTWVIQSVKINGNEQVLNTCEQVAEITFSRNLAGTNKFSNTNCTMNVGTSFSWEIEEGNVSLTANQSEPQLLQIVTLDANTFQYEITYTAELIYEYTLKAR